MDHIQTLGARRIVFWVPDWSLSAITSMIPVGSPAITSRNRQVIATTQTARIYGIKRGMTVNLAQNLCPELIVLPHDSQRDDSLFETVLQVLDEYLANVVAVTPGTAWAVLPKTVLGHHNEEELRSLITEALAVETGMEVQIGIGQGMAVAAKAAKLGMNVSAEKTPEFLQEMRVTELTQFLPAAQKEPYQEVYRLFRVLGIRKVSELYGLGKKQLLTRFGNTGEQLWNLASGQDLWIDGKTLTVQIPKVRKEFFTPLTNIDEALVPARRISQEIVEILSRRGLQAKSVEVTLEDTEGKQNRRRWAIFDSASASAIAQKIIWHIRSWQELSSMKDVESSASSGLQWLTVAVPEASRTSEETPLWGTVQKTEQLESALSQIQMKLGEEAVSVPFLSGGEDPRSRIHMIPWENTSEMSSTSPQRKGIPSVRCGGKGEYPEPVGEWAGSLRESPMVLYDCPAEVKLIGENDEGSWGLITVNRRGVLSGTPQRILLLEDLDEVDAGNYNIHGVWGPWVFAGHWWKYLGADAVKQDECLAGSFSAKNKSAIAQEKARTYLRVSARNVWSQSCRSYAEEELAELLLVYQKEAWQLEGIYYPQRHRSFPEISVTQDSNR